MFTMVFRRGIERYILHLHMGCSVCSRLGMRNEVPLQQAHFNLLSHLAISSSRRKMLRGYNATDSSGHSR